MDSRGFNEKDITSSLDGIAASIRDGGLTPSVIADVYDNTKTYAVGDYVVYEGKSYRCITAVETAENFDSEKWDQIKVLDELSSAVELPPVTSSDNGKILGVSNGKWAKTDAPTELPAVTSDDNGKVLGVAEGAWTKTDVPTELPSVTSVDNGKVLGVAEGVWNKIDPPSSGDEIVYFVQDAISDTLFYKNTIPSLTGATEITRYSDISDLFDIENHKVKDGTKIYFVFKAEGSSLSDYYAADPVLLHVKSTTSSSIVAYGSATYAKEAASDFNLYYIKASVNFKTSAVQATVKRYTITATEIV